MNIILGIIVVIVAASICGWYFGYEKPRLKKKKDNSRTTEDMTLTSIFVSNIDEDYKPNDWTGGYTDYYATVKITFTRTQAAPYEQEKKLKIRKGPGSSAPVQADFKTKFLREINLENPTAPQIGATYTVSVLGPPWHTDGDKIEKANIASA